MSARGLWFRIGLALAGLLVALAIAPHLQRRASPDELPGAMQARGLDPTSPLLQLALIVVLTFAGAMLGRVVAGSRIARIRTGPGVRRSGRWVSALVLLPTVLVVYFAALDLWHSKPLSCLAGAAILVVLLRLAVARIAADGATLAFAAVPLGIVLQLNFMPKRAEGFAALAWILFTPFIVSAAKTTPRFRRRLLAWIAYPIFAFAYPLALLGPFSTPTLDFFEDGHELVVASEMTHGELPYADIVPVHGLASDGGIDWLVMKSGHESLGDLLKVKRVVSCLNLLAIYCVALAATGNPNLAIVAVLLAVSMIPSATIWVRTIPSLFALAALCAATRYRSSRWLAIGCATSVLSFLCGMEFAVYSAAVAGFVAIRFGRQRRQAVSVLIVTVVVATALLIVACAAAGFGASMIRVVAIELIPAGRVYVPGPLMLPECRWPPAQDCISAAIWLIALIATAATVAGNPMRSSRRDAFCVIGIWMIVAAVSYAERRHLYFQFAIAPLLVAAVVRLYRTTRVPGLLAAVTLVILARPFDHLFNVATPLRLAGGVPTGNNVEFSGFARARGAVIPPEVRHGLDITAAFLESNLRPDDTFFDFSNSAAVFYFMNRRCPTRHHQVPFYETASLQREVISVLERDRSIRAALIEFPGGLPIIDGVPSQVRAPLVWRYLQQNFIPALAKDGVIIWIRRLGR